MGTGEAGRQSDPEHGKEIPPHYPEVTSAPQPELKGKEGKVELKGKEGKMEERKEKREIQN